jgi:hypothetical protein
VSNHNAVRDLVCTRRQFEWLLDMLPYLVQAEVIVLGSEPGALKDSLQVLISTDFLGTFKRTSASTFRSRTPLQNNFHIDSCRCKGERPFQRLGQKPRGYQCRGKVPCYKCSVGKLGSQCE